jgi:hypothetical protein
LLQIGFFHPDPGKDRAQRGECACCGGRYAIKRLGMKMFEGGKLEGDICPECVLAGPAGAAAKVRGRLGAMGRKSQSPHERKGRTAWCRLLSRRSRLLEATPSFSLAVRQAAARETRERR